MKKYSLYAAGASLVYFVASIAIPVAAHALPESPVIIAEVQPGSPDSASEEFIEIINVSDKPIDLNANHWQLVTASASAKDWAPYRTAVLSGILEPGASYLIGSTYSLNGATVHYLPLLADAIFSAGLAASAGHVRLTYTTNSILADGTCGPAETVADTVEWSSLTNGTYTFPSITGRASFGLTSKSGVPSNNSLQRVFDAVSGTYADTDDDTQDFVLLAPTPRMPLLPVSLRASAFTLLPLDPITDSCDPDQSAPSPGTGPTEPSDPLPIPAGGGTDGAGTGDGEDSSDGGAPGGDVQQDASITEPSITELLPNPAAPQTDADDEFIEVYNPNDTSYDLSGYALEAGGATMRRYSIPGGTVLEPHGYHAFSSQQTALSLPNTAGVVRLLRPDGSVAMQADAYANAPDGQAWAASATGWQWTAQPTPGAANVVLAPVSAPKATVTTAKATTKKAAAVKVASTKAAKTTVPKAKKTTAKKATTKKAELSTVATSVRNPIHTGVLAAVGIFALLYGAYEYRHDLANKIHQFRSNRAARRAHRQAAARR